MSQLLDSLRRPGRSALRREGVLRQPDAGAILAGMGYRSANGVAVRVRTLAIAAAVIAIVALALLSSSRENGASSPEARLPAAGPAAPADPGASQGSARAGGPEQRQDDPRPLPAKGAPPRMRVPPVRARAAQGPNDTFEKALELQQSGELDRASSLYRTLIDNEELAAQAHNNLGLIYQVRGALEQAERQFRRAVERNPEYATAHNNLGVLLLGDGRLAEAAQHFRLAARLQPRDADPLVNLALTQRTAGRPGQARESLLLALALAPNHPAAHYNLAVLYDQAGEAGRAVAHYRAFLEHAGADHAARGADARARLQALERSR